VISDLNILKFGLALLDLCNTSALDIIH